MLRNVDTVSPKQHRIAELARRSPEMAFTSLAHLLDLAWLHEAYRRTRKDGAVGIDGQTARAYEANLASNLQSLIDRVKSGTYEAPAVRRVHIPKGSGPETRPIGIPTLEDKVLQRAVLMLLEPIFEVDFDEGSYGFRPGRSAHQAIDAIWRHTMDLRGGWILEIDIRKFFDSMPHSEILAVLSERIADPKFLRLIARMLKAGVQTPGGIVYDELGVPQGSIVSPVIANAFLDHVLDQWFVTVVRQHCRGYCALLRYADDAVAVFEREEDAHRFMRVLPKRLGKFGLRLNSDKTHLIAFGKRQAWRMLAARERPATFDYLGFTHYWGRSRTGKVRLKRKTSKKRLRRALTEINHWLRRERNVRRLPDLWRAISRKMRGHFNYFGVTDNSRCLEQFGIAVRRLLFKWLNRRSQRRSFTWVSFSRYTARYPLPRPRRLVQLNPIW